MTSSFQNFGNQLLSFARKTKSWAVEHRFYLYIVGGLLALASFLLWMAFRDGEKLELLVISGGSPGGAYQRIAHALADEIQRGLPETKVVVEFSQGTKENITRVASGTAELGLVQNDSDGPANIRVVSPLHEEVLHLFVGRNSNIRQLQDLRGKRIAVGPEGGGTAKLIENLFELYGLNEAELVFEPMDEAFAELQEGTVQVCAMVTALGTPLCREILSTGQIRLLGISEPGMAGNIVEGFRLHYPFIHPATIPRGSYATHATEMVEPSRPLGSIGVRSLLICRSDLPHSVTCEVIDAVVRARPKLIEMGFPEFADTQSSFDSSYRYRFHPSVINHLSRHPTFLEQYAESMGFVLSAILAIGGIFASARQWVSQVKKDRIDEFYLKLDGIQNRLVSESLTADQLNEILRTLLETRHRAVRALVSENVVADESFLIFQSLLTESIREVERQLRLAGSKD